MFIGPCSIKIVGGSGHPSLVSAIVQHLEVQAANVKSAKHANGESWVTVGESLRDEDVYIVQTGHGRINDMLMETLVMISGCKAASARRITVVIPCFPYARQDKKTKARCPITAKLVANLISRAGADHIITMDLHAAQIKGFFKDIPVDNLLAEPLMLHWIRENILDFKRSVIISPDAGGVKRATSIADSLGTDFAIIHKERARANQVSRMVLVGEVAGRSCIIVDDMADTCGTLIKAAETLREHGATSIYALIVHPILSGPALDRIQSSCLERLIVCDTTPLSPEAMACNKIISIPVSSTLQRRRKLGSGLALAADPAAFKPDEDQENVNPNLSGTAFKTTFARTKPLPIANAVPQRPAHPPLPTNVVITQDRINWSLKNAVTFSTSKSLDMIKSWVSKCSNRVSPYFSVSSLNSVDDLADFLGYYRFPFPCIDQTQKRKMSGLLGGSNRGKRGKDAESLQSDIEYFGTLANSWRRAFLSLYDQLKTARGFYFYYFQHDFGALFRHDLEKGELQAYLCKCGEGVRTLLDKEGIRYEASGQVILEEEVEDEVANEAEWEKDVQSDEESDDEQESNAESDGENQIEVIRAEISERIKRRKLKKIHKRTRNQGLVRVKDVHEFVDFILNQRNGKSFVILPELISAQPFLFGTYCRNEIVVHSADHVGTSRIKLSGAVLPEAAFSVKKIVESVLESPIGMTSDADPRTIALGQLPYL